MNQMFSRLVSLYVNLKGKIAFYPVLFALSGVLFAIIMMYLEKLGISDYLVENVPVLVVNNGDTALTILSACITGLISMMVFSFSMVMLLLNQASTSYSPRLLPGLISDRHHQVILGIYLFGILYCIFILFSIQPTGDKYQIPGFSVLLGILSTVLSLYAFIYFIHNISNAIQITHILNRIFLSAKKELQKELESDKAIQKPTMDSSNWHEYFSETSGYIQDFSREKLLEFCKEKNTRLDVLPIKGKFVLTGNPIVRSERELSKEEFRELYELFWFSREELVDENYVLAFKQITEVIVKAMSPGINDPGTALNGIDYLTELLQLRMKLIDDSFVMEGQKHYVNLHIVKFEDLLFNVCAAIRTYGKHDIVVVQKLVIMLYYLKNQEAQEDHYIEVLNNEARNILEDAERVMENNTDLKVIKGLYQKLSLQPAQ